MARSKRVKTYGDAMVWLGYMRRFTAAPISVQCGDISALLMQMKLERDEAQERAARMAVALEKAESVSRAGNGGCEGSK